MTEKNRVLHIKKGVAEVLERPMPKPREGWVVVKQVYAPNCIEHRIYQTGFTEHFESPMNAGHEGVGVVHEIGPGVTDFSVGDRVIVFQGGACGKCWVCEHGLGATHCMDRLLTRDFEKYNDSESGGGGFQHYRLAPCRMVHKIPDDLDFKYAAAGNCLIGCTYSAMRDHNISPEHYCLVGGIGFVGHATIANLKYRGAKVIALGRHEKRIKTAIELGADLVVNPEDPDWMEQVRAFTPNGRGPDFAFECSGYPYYQQKCLDALRHYGTLVLLGYAAHEGAELKWDLNTEFGLCWGHKTITAHFDVNFNHREDLLETLADPSIQKVVDRLVTILPMSEAVEAFEALGRKELDKVYFVPGE